MPVKDINPQGGLDELQKRGLDPAEYGSCAKPVPGEVIGCSFWKGCTMSYKGKPGPECGPHNHACRIIKPESLGGGVREVAMTCYAAIPQMEQWRARGGAFQIFGDEGTEYSVRGTRLKRDDKGVPLPGYDGKSPAHYEEFIGKEKVLPFPRPDQNSKLMQSAYEANILAEARAKAERDRSDVAIGVKSTSHADQENKEAPKEKPKDAAPRSG